MLEEGLRFGAQAGSAAGPGHEHADGLLAASIMKAGALRLSIQCCWVIMCVHVCADLSAVRHGFFMPRWPAHAPHLSRAESVQEIQGPGISGPVQYGVCNVTSMMRMVMPCAGWRLHHIAGRCLYDHNPSPQRCARMGGVWDDSGPVMLHSGGQCITEAQAQQRYDAALGTIRMDIVKLAHDGNLAGFGEQGAQTAIRRARCLLWVDQLKAGHHALLLPTR